MAVGVGGLIANLMGGDPSAQLAEALAGRAPPQGGPQAAGGAPGGSGGPSPADGGPGAPGGQQPLMAPAQVYAPDPMNASTLQLLLKAHQQDESANMINRGLEGMAASFGTAQQQHDAMANLGNFPQQNTLGAIQSSLGIQAEAEKNAKEASARAGSDIMGQQILNLKPGQGQTAYDMGILPDLIKTHLGSLEPTDAVRT